MVNLISQNGYFFREIPFTTEEAKNNKHALLLYEAEGELYKARILEVINNKNFPVAFVAQRDDQSEFVETATMEGDVARDCSLKLFLATSFNAYENFRPTIYQACLIWVNNQEWRLAVCRGYDEQNNQPHFFGFASTHKSIPLCKATEGLLDENGLTWKDYVAKLIERQEIKTPTDVFKDKD